MLLIYRLIYTLYINMYTVYKSIKTVNTIQCAMKLCYPKILGMV